MVGDIMVSGERIQQAPLAAQGRSQMLRIAVVVKLGNDGHIVWIKDLEGYKIDELKLESVDEASVQEEV
jgi:hypothetical protein